MHMPHATGTSGTGDWLRINAAIAACHEIYLVCLRSCRTRNFGRDTSYGFASPHKHARYIHKTGSTVLDKRTELATNKCNSSVCFSDSIRIFHETMTAPHFEKL